MGTSDPASDKTNKLVKLTPRGIFTRPGSGLPTLVLEEVHRERGGSGRLGVASPLVLKSNQVFCKNDARVIYLHQRVSNSWEVRGERVASFCNLIFTGRSLQNPPNAKEKIWDLK